jgi:hypothetical protein
MLMSQETIGRFSGALLVTAAMLVFHMRLRYRTQMIQTTDGIQKTNQVLHAMVKSRGNGGTP